MCQTQCFVTQGLCEDDSWSIPIHALHVILYLQLCTILPTEVVVGCITDRAEDEYKTVTLDFGQLCQWSSLQVNTSQTKKVVVDLQENT